MYDRYQRRIDYLRISVTDRCNLRCTYCVPAGGVALCRHEDLLSYEEITAFVRVAVGLGISRVRLTGGEPLVRRDVVTLVAMLAAIDGLGDLAMTTNGHRLPTLAGDLAAAGLRRVNVSLDALVPARYAEITRGGEVALALAGIAAAREAGLRPIKLNCVVRRSPDEADARDVAEFGRREGCEVRFVRQMNLENGVFAKVIGGEGGDCPRCNRLRLTCDGRLRPCLFSDLAYDVRALGAESALRLAVGAKPAMGSRCRANMHTIGG
jgi:cyclic pyranopterin phosphate synthase